MTPQLNLIALVDEQNNILGYEEKLEVHKLGLLHRAFSIFVFNSKNELLLHRRALEKYHSGGLWTNTCCSHLPFGENFEEAIHSRLQREMGFDCELKELFTFRYKITFNNGLIENELDHVFLGKFDGVPKPDPAEVCDWHWISMEKLRADLKENEEKYTYWFKIAFEKLPREIAG